MHVLAIMNTESLMVITEADGRGDSLDTVGQQRLGHPSVTSGFQPGVWLPDSLLKQVCHRGWAADPVAAG